MSIKIFMTKILFNHLYKSINLDKVAAKDLSRLKKMWADVNGGREATKEEITYNIAVIRAISAKYKKG